jgi:hypothetical protein
MLIHDDNVEMNFVQDLVVDFQLHYSKKKR